jgi:hypothetical protein
MELLSDGNPLPTAYRWLVSQRLTDFGPWYLIEKQAESDAFRAEFCKEVAPPNPSPIKDFQPFARHGGHDDFAGFVLWHGRIDKQVVVVHLTFAGRAELPGFPGMTRYEDLWAWLAECVVPDMRQAAEGMDE